MGADQQLQLPETVYELLRRSRFVHLATCHDDVPSVSLMSFTLLEAPEAAGNLSGPCLVMATPKDTVKFRNIVANPRVSLLVHDWVGLNKSSPENNIATYLQSLNSIELAQRSVTLAGTAHILEEPYTEELRALHLAKHPEAECFIQDNVIIVVELQGATLADSQNHVQKF